MRIYVTYNGYACGAFKFDVLDKHICLINILIEISGKLRSDMLILLYIIIGIKIYKR